MNTSFYRIGLFFFQKHEIALLHSNALLVLFKNLKPTGYLMHQQV